MSKILIATDKKKSMNECYNFADVLLSKGIEVGFHKIPYDYIIVNGEHIVIFAEEHNRYLTNTKVDCAIGCSEEYIKEHCVLDKKFEGIKTADDLLRYLINPKEEYYSLKSTITIEVQGNDLDMLKRVEALLFGELSCSRMRGVEKCSMSVLYEEDGEYLDSDECEIELGSNSIKLC